MLGKTSLHILVWGVQTVSPVGHFRVPEQPPYRPGWGGAKAGRINVCEAEEGSWLTGPHAAREALAGRVGPHDALDGSIQLYSV